MVLRGQQKLILLPIPFLIISNLSLKDILSAAPEVNYARVAQKVAPSPDTLPG